jgi:hypothetical protein
MLSQKEGPHRRKSECLARPAAANELNNRLCFHSSIMTKSRHALLVLCLSVYSRNPKA